MRSALACVVCLLIACGSRAGDNAGNGNDAGSLDASEGFDDAPSDGATADDPDAGTDGSTGDAGIDVGTDAGTDGGTGVCGACGSPPADTCEDGWHVRRYDSIAGCSGTDCVFPSVIVNCPNGCANGACKVDACAGVTCAAPAPSCTGATLRTFSASCTGGTCAVVESDQTCANGCALGACLGQVCGGAECDTPPAPTCLDPRVLESGAQLGTCAGGCTYQPFHTLCSQGCLNGACQAGSTTSIFMPPVPGGMWKSNVAFAVDAAGRPHLVGQDGNFRLIWRHLDESGWHDEVIDAPLASGVQVALALDPTGSPVVAYHEPTNKRLRYAERRNSTFQIEQVSTTSPAGRFPSIAIDGAGVRWIASTDGAQVRVAHGQAGSWTIENVGAGSSSATQLAFDPAGGLHLVWGSAESVAVPSGSYNQPRVYHATRAGGSWQVDVVSEDGLAFKRSLSFARNGDALVAYGVVGAVGQDDELRIRRYGASASDSLVRRLSNWHELHVVGAYDGRSDLKLILTNGSTIVRGDGELWATAPQDFPTHPGILDVVDGPDGRPRYFASVSSESPANLAGYAFVTPAACARSCTGATCGSDGCGGSCGTCGPGTECGPDRTCSPWVEQTINLPPLVSDPSINVALAMSPAGEHHVAVQYHFPERYYTSGSWQDMLFYMNDATRPMALPQPETAVGIPSGNYAELQLVPSSLLLDPDGVPNVVYAQSVGGVGWKLQNSARGASPWAVDWIATTTQGRLKLLAAASAAGVTYIVDECGYSSGIGCVYRHDLIGTTKSTLTLDSARAASAAVDSMGNVHILWVHWTGSSTNKVILEYATDKSGTLVSTPIAGEQVTGSGDVFRPMIALGPDDEVHVVFRHAGTSEVRHGVWNGTTFTTETVPAVGELALAVDHAGVPGVLAVQSSAKLWRPGLAGWTSESIPTRGSASTAWLGFDAANRPHVVFQDATNVSRQLRLAWKP